MLSLTLISIVYIRIECFAFVDDAVLVFNGFNFCKIRKELQETFQQALEIWAWALGITDGELDPSKSLLLLLLTSKNYRYLCYIINFEWKIKNFIYCTK